MHVDLENAIGSIFYADGNKDWIPSVWQSSQTIVLLVRPQKSEKEAILSSSQNVI